MENTMEYVPFGTEWEKEVMKLSKKDLVELYRKSCIKNQQTNLNSVAASVHENAKEKGFYEGPKNIGEMLCLIHAEVSEALEADRVGGYATCDIEKINSIEDPKKFVGFYRSHVKGFFEEEMADITIRVMDLCAFKGIDLDAHIKAKMRFNVQREPKHGKNY